jgi:hypothetical protein
MQTIDTQPSFSLLSLSLSLCIYNKRFGPQYILMLMAQGVTTVSLILLTICGWPLSWITGNCCLYHHHEHDVYQNPPSSRRVLAAIMALSYLPAYMVDKDDIRLNAILGSIIKEESSWGLGSTMWYSEYTF